LIADVSTGCLAGRTIVVLGASRGIGRACAEAAALAGASVIGVARTSVREPHDSVATSVALDVTDVAVLREFFDRCVPIDGMINAAGTNRPGPADDVTPADFDAIFDVNARASYFALAGAARAMLRHGRSGALVTISSQMGHVGAPNRTVYCASKHAVEGMTKAFAVELASRNIRVNTVAPTFIATDLTEPMLADPSFRNDVLARIPARRIGTPADVAAAAVFLLSDAAALITGTSIRVDGGWTAL
jgi:NAD(P)-dependent dehydrogenase (short-subunit alcohol dehydrogenase family)